MWEIGTIPFVLDGDEGSFGTQAMLVLNGTIGSPFFSGHLSDEQVIKLFEGFAELVRHRIPELREFPKRILRHQRKISTTPRDEYLRLITLEYLIRSNETYLALLEDVIARLKRGEHLVGNAEENIRGKWRPARKSGKNKVAGKSISGNAKKKKR